MICRKWWNCINNDTFVDQQLWNMWNLVYIAWYIEQQWIDRWSDTIFPFIAWLSFLLITSSPVLASPAIDIYLGFLATRNTSTAAILKIEVLHLFFCLHRSITSFLLCLLVETISTRERKFILCTPVSNILVL